MESKTISWAPLYSIHNPEDEIPNLLPNRGEVFKSKTPIMPSPKLACLMQQNVLIKNKSTAAENKSQLGNKIISARRPVHIIVVHTIGRDYKSHSKQPNP